MEYVVAVRTYQRPAMFQSHTLTMLRNQGMEDRLYVFVGSDLSEYTAIEPDLRYIQVPKGGCNAIRAICDYFPEGQPILFLDDDLGPYFQYDWEADLFLAHGLHETVLKGFEMIREGDRIGMFGFSSLRNKYWLKRLKPDQICHRTIPGCHFGALNNRELINASPSHMDDMIRTVNYWKRGYNNILFNGHGFPTDYCKNAGGLQASGERADTFKVCQEALPQVAGWVDGIIFQKEGVFAFKHKSPIATKKLIAAQRV